MSVTDFDMPAVPASEAAGEAAMTEWAERLVSQARAEGVELTDFTVPQPNAINAYLPKNRPAPPHVRAFISLLTKRRLSRPAPKVSTPS